MTGTTYLEVPELVNAYMSKLVVAVVWVADCCCYGFPQSSQR